VQLGVHRPEQARVVQLLAGGVGVGQGRGEPDDRHRPVGRQPVDERAHHQRPPVEQVVALVEDQAADTQRSNAFDEPGGPRAEQLLGFEVGVLPGAQRPAQRPHVPVELAFGARRIVPLHRADPLRRGLLADLRGDLGQPQPAGGRAQFLLGLAGVAQQLVGDRVQPRRAVVQAGADEGVRVTAEQRDGGPPLVADGRGGR
jgi:hypothetical protein